MTDNPKTILHSATITQVEEAMKQWVINAIIVTDDNGLLAGVIDNAKLR